MTKTIKDVYFTMVMYNLIDNKIFLKQKHMAKYHYMALTETLMENKGVIKADYIIVKYRN